MSTINHEDVLLDDYLKRNQDLRQCDVAEKLGMDPSFISRERKKGNFWLRLNKRRRIIGHYIYKDAESEIPRRKNVAKKRRSLKKKRSKKR